MDDKLITIDGKLLEMAEQIVWPPELTTSRARLQHALRIGLEQLKGKIPSNEIT